MTHVSPLTDILALTSSVSCEFDFTVHKLPKPNSSSPHTFMAVLVLVSRWRLSFRTFWVSWVSTRLLSLGKTIELPLAAVVKISKGLYVQLNKLMEVLLMALNRKIQTKPLVLKVLGMQTARKEVEISGKNHSKIASFLCEQRCNFGEAMTWCPLKG